MCLAAGPQPWIIQIATFPKILPGGPLQGLAHAIGICLVLVHSTVIPHGCPAIELSRCELLQRLLIAHQQHRQGTHGQAQLVRVQGFASPAILYDLAK
ncbi:hypothetical protein TK34_22250 (plasmid) [Aeromonas hydrophila]|nr:hypothetical protein TK34_22250 [Aeromonas hydrophila]